MLWVLGDCGVCSSIAYVAFALVTSHHLYRLPFICPKKKFQIQMDYKCAQYSQQATKIGGGWWPFLLLERIPKIKGHLLNWRYYLSLWFKFKKYVTPIHVYKYEDSQCISSSSTLYTSSLGPLLQLRSWVLEVACIGFEWSILLVLFLLYFLLLFIFFSLFQSCAKFLF